MSLNIQNKGYQDVLFINYEIYLPSSATAFV